MKNNARLGWITNALVGMSGAFLGYRIADLQGIDPTTFRVSPLLSSALHCSSSSSS